MKISIIVPIYNVAPYLRKCVDSLLVQDYTDYEIILVDDGSTDDSGAIADEIVSEAMGNGQWAIDEDTNSQSPIANRQTLVYHSSRYGIGATSVLP
jgi:cellulose synthase/poly-beta-1,6-N-acetylglucosamine synthase-like glycosyltransferase